jgi:hypothetical protein
MPDTSSVKRDKSLFSFQCDYTMVGFFQKINGKGTIQSSSIQCFFGYQDKSAKPAPSSGLFDNHLTNSS